MVEEKEYQELLKFIPNEMEFELLRILKDQDSWKIYRKILLKYKEYYLYEALKSNDPNFVMKNIGIVAGVNFAINQLVILVDQHNKLAKSVNDKTKNHSQSEG